MPNSPTSSAPQVITIDLGIPRPKHATLLIAQPRWKSKEWIKKDGLAFLKKTQAAKEFLHATLARARESSCDLVLLPELSVPEECLPIAQEWSSSTGSMVIAGSHYFKTKNEYVARSPIIVSGSVHFTEKIVPSPLERSPVLGRGLHPGEKVLVFRNSSIGSFAILICADYLDRSIVDALPLDEMDLLCVAAFQRVSDDYYYRMNINCEEQLRGLYLAYANSLCDTLADGRSALFAVMDNLFSAELRAEGLTDLKPPHKILEFSQEQTHAVIKLDLEFKRPLLRRTVHSEPNVYIVSIENRSDEMTERFGAAIGRTEDRYARIMELFVAPNEYPDILSVLEQSHIVFITGDPGIGKTYSAVRLLRHYFDRGYTPMWFAGLEREERLNQRQVLDNFQPQSRQVIYFEDPFGRTSFENRDTVRRALGPLLDAIKDTDARIVITSRQEIFEQFSHETVSPTDLSAFTRELNVIKPSYPYETLVEILERHAKMTAWYGVPKCREAVLREMQRGKLATPLAIRDFAFSSAEVSDVSVLLDRLERRHQEQRTLFAEDIASSSVPTKIVLSLVFIAGHQPLATLIGWFNQIASTVIGGANWGGTAPFFGILRSQKGYRIESYGVRATVLRFAHPYYEEAFAAAAEADTDTANTIVQLVRFLGSTFSWSAINAVMRQAPKYPGLGVKLCTELMSVIRPSDKLFELCHLCSECLDQSGGKLAGTPYLDLVQEFLPIRALLEAVNKEADMRTLSHALRLSFNYRRELSHLGRVESEYSHSVSGLIDWERLHTLWRTQPTWANTIDAFEWASRIDLTNVLKFFKTLKEGELYDRVRSLSIGQQQRLVKLMPSSRIRTQIERAVVAPTDYGALAKFYEGDRAPESVGFLIDDGAMKALRERKNLLPVGIIEVIGHFERFDVVSIFLERKKERVAVGITEYGSEEAKQIMGHHSRMIEHKLRYSYGSAVLRHRKTAFISAGNSGIDGTSAQN